MIVPISEDTATQALPMRLFQGPAERKHSKRMREQLALIESGLLEHLRFASEVADAPARYLAEAGGKRIRPMLTLLTSELGDGPNDLVRRAADSQRPSTCHGRDGRRGSGRYRDVVRRGSSRAGSVHCWLCPAGAVRKQDPGDLAQVGRVNLIPLARPA